MAIKTIKLLSRVAQRVAFWLPWSACGVGIDCALNRNYAGEIETAVEMAAGTIIWCILERLRPWLRQ